MKIVTHRDELQQAIATVARAVSSRSTLPILSNILLQADDDGLDLVATDLEVTVRAHLAVETAEAGRTTLPARLLSEVVSAQPGKPPLELTSDDQDHVTFRCGRSVVEVHGLPADDFPPVPSLPTENTLLVPQGPLKTMIGQCIVAVSSDETRARLTGMYVVVERDRLRMVATDTHRLATRSIELGSEPDHPQSAIIPARALREVERLLEADTDEPIQVDFTDSQVQFRLRGVTIVSRLIEGEFPNYRKVIPDSHDWSLTGEVAAIRESVRRCAIVSREDNRKLILTASQDGPLQLRASSSKIGRADEEVDGVAVQVEEGAADLLEIAFNADYLLQVLNLLQSEELELQLKAANQPGAIRPIADDDYVYVLMPMQMA